MIKIKKYIRSKTDDGINDYLEELEKYILTLKASNTNNLIFKLDEINGAIVDDLQKILDEEDTSYENIDGVVHEVSRLKILNDSKDSKVFDRVMILFTKLKELQSLSNHVVALIPEVLEEERISEKVKVNASKNILQQVGDQVR